MFSDGLVPVLRVRRSRRSWPPFARGGIATDEVIAVDTSAAITALFPNPPARLVERLANAGELVAPHLIDIEFLHVVRRLVRTGVLSEDRAAETRREFADLAISRFPHEPLTDAIWNLRENLSAYDAAFVALAGALSVPLITCDAALAAAPGVAVELFA